MLRIVKSKFQCGDPYELPIDRSAKGQHSLNTVIEEHMTRHPDSDLLAVLTGRKALRDANASSSGAVADANARVHTPTMNLKSAALLAMVGTLLLTILLVAGLIFDVMNVVRGLIPTTTVLSALVHSFAALRSPESSRREHSR